jgi:hypothetical protein
MFCFGAFERLLVMLQKVITPFCEHLLLAHVDLLLLGCTDFF